MERPEKLSTFIGSKGETLIVDIPVDNRNSRYNHFPHGTEVQILGFEEICYGRVSNHGYEPGFYPNPHYVISQDPQGNIGNIGIHNLRNPRNPNGYQVDRGKLKIRDLPETTFWEWDVVQTSDGERLKILGIDFDLIGQYRNDGVTPRAIYTCGKDHGPYRMAREDDLKLVERGNIWKRGHGEDMEFFGVEEEAKFYLAVDEYDWIGNSTPNSWTLDEALAAIEEGTAHGLRDNPKEDNRCPIQPVKFWNAELGERVRKFTLREFLRSPQQGPRLF